MDKKEQIYNIVGACMEVHNALKSGLKEQVYQEALTYEFRDREIPFEREVYLPIQYKKYTLSQHYQMDFVCYGDCIVELKSAESIIPEHRNQLFTYIIFLITTISV